MFKTLSQTKALDLYRGNLFTTYKVITALFREGLYQEIFRFLYRKIKIMGLPNFVVNLSQYLSVEDMTELQLSIKSIQEKEREDYFRRLEQIFGDYGLPISTLSKKQILGFAKFVQSF